MNKKGLAKLHNLIYGKKLPVMKDGYVRPVKTFTENMTPEEIKESLKNYKQITHDDLYNVKPGTHFRYFRTDEHGHRHFKLGGNIINLSGLPEYVVFGNGKITWSVQVEGTIFYQKNQIEDIQKECDNTIKEKDSLIAEQEQEIIELKKKLRQLKKSK